MADDDSAMTRNVETAIRIGALFLVLFWVVQIVAPFIPVIVWAIIIAVASYPGYRWMLDKFDGRAGLAATTFTLLGTGLGMIGLASWRRRRKHTQSSNH